MSRRIPARDAFVLLAAAVADGLPVPETVRFNEENNGLYLFVTIAEAAVWHVWFGGVSGSSNVYLNAHNPEKPFHAFRGMTPAWRGWSVNLVAYEEVQPAQPATSKTADKVRAVAAAILEAASAEEPTQESAEPVDAPTLLASLSAGDVR